MFLRYHTSRRPTYWGVVFALLLVASPAAEAASVVSAVTQTYDISGDLVTSGDLVSFDRASQQYLRTTKESDPDVFGVVVQDPAVELRRTATGVPIATTGEVLVNVSSVNGPITAGDYLAASAVPGRAQRSTRISDVVIGVALEDFPLAAAERDSGVATVYTGSIRAVLGVGVRSGRGNGEGLGPGAGLGGSTTGLNTPLANVIKYVLAAIVVVGSIYLAFHNFGSTLKDSIVSVGRNPLAKSAIQSMVVINVTLVIVIMAVGLFIGLMILFVQL